MMLSKIPLWEISLTQPYSFSGRAEGLALVAENKGCMNDCPETTVLYISSDLEAWS